MLPLLPNTKRATRNIADATAQDARDRAERIVDTALDRARRMGDQRGRAGNQGAGDETRQRLRLRLC